MASEIKFVSEGDIEFISSTSLPNLRRALLHNFFEDDSESEENLSSSDGEWSEFSDVDQSSGEDASYEDSPVRKKERKKKAPKLTSEVDNSQSSSKKKNPRKYISIQEVQRLEDALKSCASTLQIQCETELKNDKSLSMFPLRKKIVSAVTNSVPIREMFGNLCQDMFSQMILTFTEVANQKMKNSEKRALFAIKSSQVLLSAEDWETWKNIKTAITTSFEGNEQSEEINQHAAVVLSNTYWTLYEHFLNTVMQIKIDSDSDNLTRNQSIAATGGEATPVVDSDFVDVARVSGAALCKLRKGKEKIVKGRKGAKRVSETTKRNYAREVELMAAMACSAEEKKSLPLGLRTLDEGNLTFFNSKFSVVLSLLDKRIREMLNEKNQQRYPKNLMKLTKQAVCLDEELMGLFLTAAEDVCTAPLDQDRICSIWKDLVKKICHTRFKEFYSAQEEKKLTQEGKIVSADQSLRDKLKTYSVDKRA